MLFLNAYSITIYFCLQSSFKSVKVTSLSNCNQLFTITRYFQRFSANYEMVKPQTVVFRSLCLINISFKLFRPFSCLPQVRLSVFIFYRFLFFTLPIPSPRVLSTSNLIELKYYTTYIYISCTGLWMSRSKAKSS